MRKAIKFFIFTLTLLMVIFPALSLAGDLVPCTGSGDCNFEALMRLVDNVIDFILKLMVVPIAAIMMAYAGFLLVTAGEESAGAKTKAKSIFTNAIIGLIIALVAWLVVKLILTTLGYTGPGLLNG